jgi:hypothetical protein
MWVFVDVFGVPANEPEVHFNYNYLNAYYYQHISNNGIVNGTRYWFYYNGNVSSGSLKVKRHNGSAIDYADQIYIK